MKTLSTLFNGLLAALSISVALTAAAQTPVKPKVGSITYVGFAGGPLNLTEQVAIDRGLFAAHGLDVKYITAGAGPQMVSALMGGSAQIGVLTMSASAPLIRQGQCFQYLTSGARAYFNLLAQPDLKLPNASVPFPGNLVDLKGKKIGIVARGTVMEFIMETLLKQAGVNPADVTYIGTGGAATAVAAFRNRQIDVALTFPIQEQMLKPNEYQVLAKLHEIEKNNPIYGLTQVFSGTTCDFAKSNPAIVSAFCSAIGEAYRYVNNPANTEVVISVVQKTLSIDKPTAESFWQQYKASWPSPKIDIGSWNAQKIVVPQGTEVPNYADHVPSSCQSKL